LNNARYVVLAFVAAVFTLATAPTTPTSAATFMVNSIGDGVDAAPGNGVCATATADCSLRAAIEEANALPGTDAINFNIAGAGPHPITPASALPIITQPVTIDGYTQPGSSGNTNPVTAGSNAVLKIVLQGASAGAGANGLWINYSVAGATTVRGLVINSFSGAGIRIDNADGNLVQGNFIGTDAAGTGDLGSTAQGVQVIGGNSLNDTIGGTAAADRNLISGNQASGILLTGSGHQVQGNLIGTDATGVNDLGNSVDGVTINGGTTNCIGGTGGGAVCTPSTNARNILSGNDDDGIEIQSALAADNTIVGNYIGLQVGGVLARANTGEGIFISNGANAKIGGSAAAANRIAFNTGDGVNLTGGTGTSVRANSIYSNGTTNLTLGIDLGTNGVTANDAGDGDTGANNLQNFPVLTSASSASGQTAVVGTLNSTASTVFNVDFYHGASCDASGNGEGEVFLGSMQVTTNSSGNAAINATLSGSVAAGRAVTATATRNAAPLDTSEFSSCVTAAGATSWFRPSSSATLSSSALGANPDTTTTFDIPTTPDVLASNGHADPTDWFPALGMGYTDGSFTIAADAAITNGATVGSFQTVATVGIANGACNALVPVALSLREADTNSSDTIASGSPPDPLANLVADNRGANSADPPNGLPDYLDATPTFNNAIFRQAGSGTPITPRARYAGHVLVSGTRNVMLQIVVFDPAGLSGTANGGWSASALGYPAVAVMGDPTAGPATMNSITDSCSQLSSTVVLCGRTDTDLVTSGCQAGVGTQTRITSAAATRTVQTVVQTKSLRDLDNDGIENQLDPCPTINSGAWDPRGSSTAGDADLDGLPAVCDPNDAAANNDQDGDGWPNRIDNCPLVVNGAGQLDQDVASNAAVQDGGPRSDGIGAACDAAPGTPNGNYHRTALVYRNCITGNVAVDDTDGDGVCETGPVGTITDPNDTNTDSDGDGVSDRTDNCLSASNPATAGFTQVDYDMDGAGDPCDSDVDGDTWSNAAETTIGTDPLDPCPENASDNAWPADINNDNFSDISDVSALTGVFGQLVPPAPARYNIAPDVPDGFVDITDISRMTGLFGQSCGVLYGTTTGAP